MTRMAQRMMTLNTALMALVVLASVMFAAPAVADGYYYHTPTTTTTSSPRLYNYSAGYRSGGGSYGWSNSYGGRDSSTGYTGADTSINTPHRGDWYAKLQAQRQWDEAQYQKMQQNNGLRCGFTGAPDYCYRIMGPYPQELRVVRY